MRILHIAHRLYPPCTGGLSLYVDKICQLHAKRGHKIEAWTTLEDDRPKLEMRNGYLIRRFPARFHPFENPITISLLPQLLRYSRDNLDLIVAHSHLMFTTSLAVIKSWLSSVPLVLVSHGYEVRRDAIFNLLQHAYLYSVGRTIARRSSCVITLTSREATRFIEQGTHLEKCVTISSGVDSHVFTLPTRIPDRRRIVWVGRFVAEKNLGCLLRAFALLKSRISDTELLLAGDGPERPKLIALTRSLGVNDDVKFLGSLPQNGIAGLLQTAMVYALPSTAEALPLGILEAMSSGVPLVISKGLGLEEVVNGAALVADPRSPTEWASRIEMLLRDERLRKSMALRARELAVEHYDWQKVANKLEQVFISVIEKGGPPRFFA